MSYAPDYDPTVGFATEESNQVAGRSTVRTVALDTELANISSSINGLNTNLKLLQRDDGKFLDSVLEPYALSEQSRALITAGGTPRGEWRQDTDYSIGDAVQESSVAYLCVTPHNSGTIFAPGLWLAISGDGSALASAQAAAASAAEAATSEDNAAASETASAASATTALGYKNTASTNATNAANSASAALTYQTNAQNSATAAATNATNASNSATAAASSASAAAASADLIDFNLTTDNSWSGINTFNKAITLNSAAINDSISTVASAASPDIWTDTAANIDYTGTVAATGFAAAPQAGAKRTLILAAAAPFTAGANMLIDGYATGETMTLTAGDRVEVLALTTTKFRLRALKVDGGTVLLTGNQTIAGVKTFSSQPIFPQQSMVRLNTTNGWATTNTCIARFLNTVVNQGSDITYADSATLGATFTINTAGVYAITYVDSLAGAGDFGISIDSTQLSTGITAITLANKLVATSCAAGFEECVSTTVYLPAGSVIRAHGNGAARQSANYGLFTITKVA